MTLVELPCDSRLASSVLGGPFDSLVNVMLYISCAPKLYCLVPRYFLILACYSAYSEGLFSVVNLAVGVSMEQESFHYAGYCKAAVPIATVNRM